MSAAAASAFMNEVATNPELLRRIDLAVKIATEQAALAAIVEVARTSGYKVTAEELEAGPESALPPGNGAVVIPLRGRAA